MLAGDWVYVVALAASFMIVPLASPAGVSGAVLLLPFQVGVLGTPSPSVTPTNLLYNVVATPGALFRYWRQGSDGWSTHSHAAVRHGSGCRGRIDHSRSSSFPDRGRSTPSSPSSWCRSGRGSSSGGGEATNPSVDGRPYSEPWPVLTARRRRLRGRHLRHRGRLDPRTDPHQLWAFTSRSRTGHPCRTPAARFLHRGRRDVLDPVDSQRRLHRSRLGCRTCARGWGSDRWVHRRSTTAPPSGGHDPGGCSGSSCSPSASATASRAIVM